jgi:nucleoside-diphosphate-sugar epimerase
MKIFVTGATGYVGGPVVAELVAADHEVTALCRSAEKEPALRELGANPLPGDLTDAASYRDAAGAADAIIHLGFDYRAAVDADRTAIDTFLAVTEGRDAIVIGTSGLWVLGDTGGRTLGDDAPTDAPAAIVKWRVPHERRVLEAGGPGTGGGDGPRRVTAVVRPGYVYGGGGGSTARMFATAVKSGAAEYIGDGANHWNNIHVDDLARLYLAIVETRTGGVFNAVDGTPETVAAIATAACLAAGGDGSINPVPLEKAREKIGPVADAMCLDARLSAPAARALGWAPRHSSFTKAAATAFAEWRAARRG